MEFLEIKKVLVNDAYSGKNSTLMYEEKLAGEAIFCQTVVFTQKMTELLTNCTNEIEMKDLLRMHLNRCDGSYNEIQKNVF